MMHHILMGTRHGEPGTRVSRARERSPGKPVQRRVRSAACALLCASALLSIACNSSRTPSEERAALAERGDGDIVIGVAWPWSEHKDIRYGEGLEMAVDEVNGGGGVLGRQIRLLREDDHGSVDEGRLVAQRLGNDPEVVAVIGHLQSFVSVPAAAIYDLSGVVMISPTATDPELTSQGYRRVFRATFTDKTVGKQMADFAAARGYGKVAIYYIRNSYGRGLANAFEERANELGVSIAARQSYDDSGEATVLTFAPTLREWGKLDLDAIFLAGEVPSATLFISAARNEGLTLPILGGDAMNSRALLTAGPAAEGTVVPSVFHPDEPRPEVHRFAESFARKYGAAPDAGSALGYDAVHLIADAVRRAKSTAPDRIADALHATGGWKGVTGSFIFDEHGDIVNKTLVKMVVRGGKFEYVGEPVLSQAPVAP